MKEREETKMEQEEDEPMLSQLKILVSQTKSTT